MKKTIYILICFFVCWTSACRKMDIPPINIIQDKDALSNAGGVQAYMARLYSQLPIEDFRYSPQRGLNFFWIISPFPAVTGEALSRDQRGAMQENVDESPWAECYSLIRDANYFIENLPKYSSSFTEAQVNSWLGEARFVRAATYFALVKRYGGVPLIDKVLEYPTPDLESLNIPRSSEEAIYDFIATDLDYAYQNISENNQVGRANKYVAAGFKSRAMLYAGSIAKYNNITLVDAAGNRVCGIPSAKAVTYFKASYDAAVLLENKYSLYKKAWAAGDKTAQYQNFVNMFFDATSPENVFVRQYHYPESVHGYDAYNVPRQLMGANGYSAEVNPTLDYVELFDGLPKNADGTIKTMTAGKYDLYNTTMDLFANAEPRLRATVILPGDEFKGQSIEIRRGIYTGSSAGGISPLLPAGSTANYPTTNIVQSSNASQTPYTLPDGSTMNPAGLSGIFTGDGTCAISGFSVRKWLVPDKPTSEVLENRSDQTWIEMRYAEVLLNRAEAAYELNTLGQNDKNYLQDAFTIINQIRERAGADFLASAANLNDIDIIRNERRKELGFENKIWWDMRRWRTADKEQNSTIYRVLMPFYSANDKKYFFDARTDERNIRYTFDVRWYYEQIPNGEIQKSQKLIQNPGY
ncbi:RagB/SusD family nutrient uptake outer membrane protein [Mucilaginibacter sp. 14171R-50]|uniref:RagB/SusD family nutrient uptake outer membrane protein n=1 Tax=Mucilaginibacter sp. 14171R-50 TaxID=2703789 RepID=UPI00138CF6A6|nr:RagB/SusD family nutrient uptake outer membrane protein [Mucilaginibacter sp. 14171R-50]QHS56383.1 RagB/SusD family nutrient uptake outer membrane protein [Mucilaginibacter sp. 14171R-50]